MRVCVHVVICSIECGRTRQMVTAEHCKDAETWLRLDEQASRASRGTVYM